MKVLLVNGSPKAKGCTYTALQEAAAALEKQGIETEIFQVGTQPVAGCVGCGVCRKNGECFRNDVVNEFVKKAGEADGYIFGSPIHYASASGALTSFMDRAFYSGGSKMAGKPAAAVVSCRRGGARSLNRRLRPDQQIFHHQQHARSLIPVLEHGTWQHPRRGQTGRRRPPDHAYPRQQHGLAHQMHRGRKESRNHLPGEGAGD